MGLKFIISNVCAGEGGFPREGESWGPLYQMDSTQNLGGECYELTVSPSNPYTEVPISNVIIFGDGALGGNLELPDEQMCVKKSACNAGDSGLSPRLGDP